MSLRGRDDAELLAACVDDPEAFADFYRRHARAIFAYFMTRLHRADLAADLTGEVFASALDAARRDVVVEHPRAWLYGIAHHTLAATIRRRRVADEARSRLGIAPIELTDDELERTEALVDLDTERARLNALLEELPEAEAQALRARIVDEQDYVEIASALECSEAVVRKRVSRGLARLRSAMRTAGQ
ncbi:MAG TPA: RNA polymerase sigma factor [Thermoleophilaceae bacterium]|jgi:RNA polymerase sigma-70 factor (ECF subfamily)|nr:RNA polymerase sigma factor [Thermoleophilaceae bacterium]